MDGRMRLHVHEPSCCLGMPVLSNPFGLDGTDISQERKFLDEKFKSGQLEKDAHLERVKELDDRFPAKSRQNIVGQSCRLMRGGPVRERAMAYAGATTFNPVLYRCFEHKDPNAAPGNPHAPRLEQLLMQKDEFLEQVKTPFATSTVSTTHQTQNQVYMTQYTTRYSGSFKGWSLPEMCSLLQALRHAIPLMEQHVATATLEEKGMFLLRAIGVSMVEEHRRSVQECLLANQGRPFLHAPLSEKTIQIFHQDLKNAGFFVYFSEPL